MKYYQALSRYCSYQERCLQEIEDKLRDIEAPEEEWKQLTGQLQADGFWNEERFARSFARGKFRIKGWGRIRIQFELRTRGITAGLIQQALEEINETEYFETAVKLVQKKKLEVRKEPISIAHQKVHRYLVQKGFESQLVREILAVYWNDTE